MSDEAFRFLLANGRVFDDVSLNELFCELVPDGVAVPIQGEVNRIYWAKNEEGGRRPRRSSPSSPTPCDPIRTSSITPCSSRIAMMSNATTRRIRAALSATTLHPSSRGFGVSRDEFLRYRSDHAAFEPRIPSK